MMLNSNTNQTLKKTNYYLRSKHSCHLSNYNISLEWTNPQHFHLLKHLLYPHLFGVEARFPFINPLMCLVKKTAQHCKAQHNVCDHTG